MLAERPQATGIGIDASAAALKVARKNAQALGLEERASFERLDWRDPHWADMLGRHDLVIANPPYVEEGASLDPQVRDFEPHSALFAGVAGLDDYRIITPSLVKLLLPGGKAVLEIGASQQTAVSELAESEGFRVEVRHDLANRPRALVLS